MMGIIRAFIPTLHPYIPAPLYIVEGKVGEKPCGRFHLALSLVEQVF
jgi:hypothetical protein